MIVLIGGTGFLGRHVCEVLAANKLETVSVSRRPDTEFLAEHAPGVRGVRTDDPALSDILRQAEHVLYFAHRSRPAIHAEGPRMEVSTNLSDVAAFLHTLMEVNPQARLTYLSSGGQIYGSGFDAPITEDAAIRPATAYGLGKSLVETLLNYYVDANGSKIAILRLANPVGRWQLNTSHGLVSAAVQASVSGQPLTIFGDGGNARDYFDADDFAQWVTNRLILGPAAVTGTYNIGSGRALTETDVVETVNRTLGRPVPYNFAEGRPFDLRYAVLDCGRAERELGWTPGTGLDETIRKIDQALHAT
ncbi:NAD-dependent epimerase/dehydratase family protein [Maricaulis sp.]|uniref:NAD-dependent epimerase/dehydratase family protein n=1 Tax=Maricaulis sp. TaxID=1486257 RepID=UPI0025C16B45|nr:NAD-dependent epimerase/dehydratase family protein [Maricaulis sp.]